MKFIVGLGNPGNQYAETRHNVGFRFLDLLAQSEGLRFSDAPRFRAQTVTWHHNGEKIQLIKPQTFMNNSGESIGALARYYQIEPENIIVVYDDLDLPSGKIRLKRGGGHAGHNGLRSLNNHLENNQYIRIRIGIDRPSHGDVSAWVLGKTSHDESMIEKQVFDVLLNEVTTILQGDTDRAANRIHLALQATHNT